MRAAILATLLPSFLLTACAGPAAFGEPAAVSVFISGPSVTVGGSPLPMLITTVRELTVTVTGTSNDPVTWSLAEGATAGSITQQGRYTAGTTTGTYHVVATSKADTNAVDSMAITVMGLGTPTSLVKLDSVRLASASNGLAFTADGNRLYVSTISAGVVYAINPANLAKIDSFVVGSGAQRLAVSPSGDSVYVANEVAGAVNVIRPSTHTITNLSIAGTPYGLALSADGAALYVALRTAGKVRVLRRPQLDSLGTLTVGGIPRNVAAAPDGTFMVVSTQSDIVRIP